MFYTRNKLEMYRSGRNELDSKSSCPQGHVGSNPTVSVVKRKDWLKAGPFCFGQDGMSEKV